MSTEWFYALLAALVFGDSVIAIIPSELPLNFSGAYAGAFGYPNIFLVIIIAIVAAFIGDHVCFFLGRFLTPLLTWASRWNRVAKLLDVATRTLEKRGGVTLIVARFIPGCRWIVTVTLGSTGYPLSSFTFYDSLGVVVWAIQGTVFGYLAGLAFHDNPLIGLVVGIIVGVLSGLLIERIHSLVTKRREAKELTSSH